LLPNSNRAYAKSNAAAVARAVSRSLSPGDVVVVTQTEQIAVVAHYLPKGLVYVTPTGVVTDPYVVNWRNIVHRLQNAQPCATVDPVIAAMPLGASVLEIDPGRQLGVAGSAWHRAVFSQVTAIDELLATNPALELTGIYEQATHPKPYSPVAGKLYRKISSADPCR
jgi:hypothetical protein